MAAPPHLAFVLEQTLGHITHSANLRAALSDDPAARISWLPIEYQSQDRLRRLPLISRNWTVASSLMARRELIRLARQGPIDAYFFHTQVTALGEALTSADLKGRTFILAGHTDAKGSDTYNQGLSERRADAVKQFLTEKYGIEVSHLATVGYGKAHLKNTSNPFAGENRRVQVVNATDR